MLPNNNTAACGGFLFESRVMLVQKGHKIQLLPNNEQKTTFRQWAGTARWAYNWGLEKKIEAYEEAGQSPGAYSLMKGVTQLKKADEHAWLRDVSVSVPRMALMQLERAYANFFRRCKEGDVVKGFPKWKSKKRSKVVFHLEPNTVKIEDKRIRLPKIGWVRMTKPLRFAGKLVGTVAISEQAGAWYASINVETEHVPADSQGRAIGIDLGIKTLATLSDGMVYDNPRALKYYEKLLAKAQRQLAKKQKGSKRRAKAKLRVQRIQKRIADIRANTIHKATTDIVGRYSFVAMEDLNVKGMVKNHNLARAVSDAAFGEFRRQMQYKLDWDGGELTLVDQWFPSSKLCSECGCINSSVTLANREWTCPDCETHHDRDHNAATNILAKALETPGGSSGAGRGGLEVADSPVKRQAGIPLSPAPVSTQAQICQI